MTYQNNMTTYEFTAFSEAQLLAQGGNGSSIGCGDTFTMPTLADTCLTVEDNDKYLSGDSWCNENANDSSGQKAAITQNGQEVGNGGQIYAEVFYWVTDQNGNKYVMIEVEQEGTGEDFFTFYSGHGYELPPAGAELTVGSACNVTSDWVNFETLGAGDKEPEPAPWTLDPDTCAYTLEAEDMALDGFKAVSGNNASEGELVKITGRDGSLSTEFGGESGVYNLTINAQDESDGKSKLMVYVNGELQQTIKLDAQSDGRGSNNGNFSEITLNGLEIAEGDDVEIRAWRDGGEYVRIDKLTFEQSKFAVCDDPDAVNIDFEGFSAGNVLSNQLEGITITAMGGSGDAMIFDSQNPTGGDGDLETQVAQQGNVLIVSEDGDSSDPDDVVGGKLTFDFDNPSAVFDLKVIDTEEGGTITLTLADGSTETFEIPNLVNGGVGQVVMNVENVVSMEVALNGSGAIDDLCFVPGQAPPPPGALSGTYFCDDDRDGVDGGTGVDADVAGKTVVLLEADGVTPATDASGNLIASTVTDEFGNYRFDNLLAASYVVMFASSAAEGKEFVAANVGQDTTIDSDVTDLVNGKTSPVEVFAGEETTDVDVGVQKINEAPDAVDDLGAVCVGQSSVVDLLTNDTDPEDMNLSVTSISDADETAGVGESITLSSGAVATLNSDGTVSINAANALPDLLIGDTANDEFQYVVSDEEGLTDTADVSLVLKGALNTVDTIDADLADVGIVSGLLTEDLSETGELFNLAVADVEFPTSDLGAVLAAIDEFELVFCLSIATPIDLAPNANEFDVSVLNADSYLAAAAGAETFPTADFGINPENIDNVNWLMNEAVDLLANGYTEGDIQRAIWDLVDGGEDNKITSNFIQNFYDDVDAYSDEASADELVALALANDGFVAGAGDMVALSLDPVQDGVQPLLAVVEFDLLAQVCDCDDFIL
ncbi:MAG: SdrD B-like domain-containing protein [Aliishimia sp.]